jgi:CheY-like chemotaxis protein
MPAEAHVLLVVDDDFDQSESLALLLETYGYSVVTAASGADALELLAVGLRPCLIVLDLMMPDMDAHAFARRQHAAEDIASIPVIVYSAGVDLASHARATGAVAHVRKPDASSSSPSPGSAEQAPRSDRHWAHGPPLERGLPPPRSCHSEGTTRGT